MGIELAPRAAGATPVVSPRQALAATPWLSAVPDETLAALADRAVLHRIPAGAQMFDQGETPNFVILLIGGLVELLAVDGGEEWLVDLVRPPDLLLPAAVLSRQTYLVRARVWEEAQVVLIQAEAFRSAVARDHALCLAVLACESSQFRRQMKQAKAIRLRSAEARVAHYLLALWDACESRGEVRLPLEKRLIASQLGMTRETFSRSLSSLAGRGLRVEGDRLCIAAPEAARAAFPVDPLIDAPEPITPLAVDRTLVS
jgi:CRP/FNR family transcriptional activator FtrB